MATLVNSISLIANPSSKSTRNVHEFMHNLPNLHFVSLKKGFFRILASAQMSVTTPKETFKIPSWERGKSDTKIKVLWVLDAYRHFEGMVELGHKPDYVQGKKLLSGLFEYGKLEEAVRVMEKMIMCGVMPEMNFYSRLVNLLCYKGKVRLAMQLMEKLEEYEYPADTTVFNAIVKGLSMCGTLNLQVLDKLLRKGFVRNASTYNILVDVVYMEKGVDEATRFLDEIASSGETLNLNCYNILLTGLRKDDGRTDEAIQLFRELPSKGFHPNTASRNILLGSLCNENRWEEATALLDEIGEKRNTGTFNILIRSLAQQGKAYDAFGVINEMRRAKMRPDPHSYIIILEILCKAGKFKPAVKCVNQMISHGYRGNQGIYNTIARLCMHEKVREALILIQRFGSIHPLPKLEFYNWVIQCLCRKWNTQPAFQLLSEMMKDGFVPNSFTYCSLIRGLCAEGMVDEAMEFVSAMEEHGYQPSVDNFNSLIDGLCQHGSTDLSFEVFETMIEKGCKPNEKTYIVLVEGIAREDEMELAEEVLKELHQKQVLSPDVVEKVCMEFALKISY